MRNSSADIKELATALAKVQGELRPALMDKTNTFFKSKYADLASIWTSCRAVLSSNGFSVVQLPGSDGTRVTLTTILFHVSGQWVEGEASAPVKEQSAQAYGSAITYLRRYALAAMVGIVADEDDDGNEASANKYNRDDKYYREIDSDKAWLKQELISRGVPQDSWKDVSNALNGRPKSDLDGLLK